MNKIRSLSKSFSKSISKTESKKPFSSFKVTLPKLQLPKLKKTFTNTGSTKLFRSLTTGINVTTEAKQPTKVTQETKPSEPPIEKATVSVEAAKEQPVTQQEAMHLPSDEKSDIPIEIIKGEKNVDKQRFLFNKKFGPAFDKCFKTDSNTYKHDLTNLDKISLQPLMNYYLSTPFTKAQYKDFILKCLMTSKIEKYKSLPSPLKIEDPKKLAEYNTKYGKDVDDFINELLKQ